MIRPIIGAEMLIDVLNVLLSKIELSKSNHVFEPSSCPSSLTGAYLKSLLGLLMPK